MSKPTLRIKWKNIVPYLFIMPAGAFLAIFSYGVVAFALYVSFHHWPIIGKRIPAGLFNYFWSLQDTTFGISFINTVFYGVGRIGIGVVVSLLMAILVNELIRPVRVFMRTIFYLPVVTSIVACSIIWMWIYNPRFGLANSLLSKIGLAPQNWLLDMNLALLCLIIMSIWKGFGYHMVIFLAGLQGIPESYYEAARIDGANKFQLFIHITWPLLAPATFFVVVTGFIGALQTFAPSYLMTQGGPGNATRVMVQYIYEQGFVIFSMGKACAMAFILFALILGLTLFQFKFFGKHVEY